MDFIETIFAAVMVFFVAVFAWIAALFQWNDVKRTQRVLEGCISTFLDAFPTINKNIKNQLITTIKGYEAGLDAKIDEICASLLPDKPVMHYVNENKPSQPEEEESISSDYMAERLLKSDFSNAHLFTQEEIEELRSSVADVMEMWMQMSGNIAEDEEFKKVNTYFDETFRTVDGFFDNLLVSVLKLIQGVLHLFMSSMTALISITFDTFQSMIGLLDKLLRKRIDIPFFTDLYRLMTGDELNLLNLVCFVFAVPAVTIGKIVLGHAPYENEKQVSDTISYLKSVFSFTKTNRQYLNKEGRAGLTGICFCVGFAYNSISAFQDYDSCTSQNDRYNPVPASAIDYISWVLELAWLGLSTPWIYETEKEPVSDGSIGLWGVFTFGVVLDGAFLFKSSHIDKSGWKGRACTSFYGFVHFLTIMAITNEEKLAAENCIPDFCGGLAESVKILIDLDINRSKYNSWCRFVVVPADVITAVVVLACGIVNMVNILKEET